MKKTENTAAMFQLIICENYVVGEALGLSCSKADSVACHAFEHTDDVDERVRDVLNCAENWKEMVEWAIEDIESGFEEDDRRKWESDLKILNEMKGWTFDAVAMESMARAECRDEQEAREAEEAQE